MKGADNRPSEYLRRATNTLREIEGSKTPDPYVPRATELHGVQLTAGERVGGMGRVVVHDRPAEARVDRRSSACCTLTTPWPPPPPGGQEGTPCCSAKFSPYGLGQNCVARVSGRYFGGDLL